MQNRFSIIRVHKKITANTHPFLINTQILNSLNQLRSNIKTFSLVGFINTESSNQHGRITAMVLLIWNLALQ